jgi:hypothetical protein
VFLTSPSAAQSHFQAGMKEVGERFKTQLEIREQDYLRCFTDYGDIFRMDTHPLLSIHEVE